MTAESVNHQSTANNRTLMMVLVGVVVLIAVGLGLFFLLHNSTTTKKSGNKAPHFRRIGAVLMTAPELKAESKLLGTPIYWAGPLKGYSYEFTRTTTGNLYVRYLPKGLRENAPGSSFLIVSTYPFIGAYKGLKKASHGAAIPGPDGGILYVNPSYRQSVLMAWPGVNYQVEIYNPKPAVAVSTAQSGLVAPVRAGS